MRALLGSHERLREVEPGVAFQILSRTADAEKELRRSVELQPDEHNLYELAKLLWGEQRPDEAVQALLKAAELSLQPEGLYFDLANADLKLQRPQEALSAFDKVDRFDYKPDDITPEVVEFHARVAEGRASAWNLLGNTQRASEFQLAAVNLTPRNRDRWIELARLYRLLGRPSEADKALQAAQKLGGGKEVPSDHLSR